MSAETAFGGTGVVLLRVCSFAGVTLSCSFGGVHTFSNYQFVHASPSHQRPKSSHNTMYKVVLNFRDFDDRYGYEDWESHLEAFFRYFVLTSEEKQLYAQMKLVGESDY